MRRRDYKRNSNNVTPVGFEPTRIAPPELESGALDHSAKLSCFWKQGLNMVGKSRKDLGFIFVSYTKQDINQNAVALPAYAMLVCRSGNQ